MINDLKNLPKENIITQLINGEPPQNASLILSGLPGAGKTIFALNIFGAQMQKGFKCLYVALERPVDSFLDQLKKLGYDPNLDQIIIVDGYSWRTGGDSKAKYSLKNLSNLNELSVKMHMALNDLGKGGFYLVDSLTNLATYNEEKEILHFFGVNSARLKINDLTGLWIVEKGIHNHSFGNMLNHLSDGVIEIKLFENGNKFERKIRPYTLRGMSNSNNWCYMDISDRGRIFIKELNNSGQIK